ncbi:MAG TPA: sigma 54-interacting transcriptional regulator [Pseudomonadota bacterium]|nr:sigma 54-interacting transcriptional regulator [Deltaproteobacteria bacterium]HPH26079.1 sigma 54-interacting transcriptional regulator [Pseudomonadota bacterium]
MPSLVFRVPDLDQPITLSLEPGTAVLLGRNPDLGKLHRAKYPELAELTTSVVRVPSQRVSANHLLVYCTAVPGDPRGERTWLRDLNSRNGSFVQVPPLQPVQIPGEGSLLIEMAALSPEDPRVEGPTAVDWSAEREYPKVMARAVSLWFERLMVPAMVRVAPRQPPSDSAPVNSSSFPLADESELQIEFQSESTTQISLPALLDQVQRFVSEQNSRYEQLQGHEDGFVLASRALRDAHQQLAEAAARGMRVMLLGPTGSGKDRLARCYHVHSRQQRGPYAILNCALLKENLLYAQLFGAKKGSFTGCTSDITGVVEAAHDGTLFLDEVGDMDLEVQKALLRFLDSRGEFQRLGDPRPRRVNVQIVCATNVELDDINRRLGRFRDDLWYRLAVKVVRIPPLAERREDIVSYLRTHTLTGSPLRVFEALTPGALQRVLSDSWPGNFRDLENFVERLPSVTRPQSIDEQECVRALREGRGGTAQVFHDVDSKGIGSTGNWQDVSAIAAAAFVKDHGDKPRSWGQIQLYTEKYLKPVFIAHASGLVQLDELGKNQNYSELARRLNIADGTTVKMHLQRYIERFAQKKPGEY